MNMDKTSRFVAGMIRVKCEIRDELIERMEIHGDFFAGEALGDLCNALIGCPYDREKVYKVLSEKKSDNIIYGISKEELLEAMF